ncbi:MAG: hypothetical protein BWY72_01439 [Bacteroidetes bacterium ADurb.Bin416]|nr:MAG: hypothetical protein BWY72_01439 [Bacteroidetes bacterium ADurb.Bin416]
MVHRLSAGDFFQNPFEQVEGFDVPVVVHYLLMVVFQVVFINHHLVLEVNGGGFVGDVDHVIHGDVPNGKGLKLGVTGFDAALVFMIEVVQAGGQLTATRTWASNHHNGLGGFDVFVHPVTLVADNEFHISGVTFDGVMGVDFDATLFQAALEGFGSWLVLIPGDDDGCDVDAPFSEIVNGLEGVIVIGNAKISSDFLALDGTGVDAQNDINLVLE